MNPNDTHREQLSALIDGALDTDQSRFLLRRLQHDAELANSLSRWQLAGDVLRGDAEAPAPHGFAEAIAARIADEPLPLVEGDGISVPVRAVSPADVATHTAVARGARWRWFGGGAMAASLAIVSVLALRPDAPISAPTDYAVSDAASLDASASPVMDAANNAVAASTPVVAAVEPTTNREPAASTATSTAATRASDVTRTPVRVASAAPMPTRARALREGDLETAAPRIDLPVEAALRTAQTQPTPAADPFKPPAAKAWPRAVIPGAGSGTFNASFNSDASYYPFAPRRVEPTDSE